MSSDSFPVILSFQGRTATIEASVRTTADELIDLAHDAGLGLTVVVGDQDNIKTTNATSLKILYKGKRLEPGTDAAVFAEVPKKTPKIMVLATQSVAVQELNSKRSDPTIRGFDQEQRHPKPIASKMSEYWGPETAQDKNYKFCRFQACTWQSFGTRPTDSTPHDFAALQLLEKLATDPGIKAVLRERQLVVTTLGEMDPIDDRLMRQKQTQGACLLGYNTNGGQRIDLKLRTDDLRGFRPYDQLAATLIHELSHNWVGEHNLLFWTNYGQMRAEYFYEHTLNNTLGLVINGKTTAQLAGLIALSMKTVEDVFHRVMAELTLEMGQHGLHPAMISTAIRERCQQLEEARSRKSAASTVVVDYGQAASGSFSPSNNSTSRSPRGNPREMAMAASEKRRDREREQRQEPEKKSSNKE